VIAAFESATSQAINDLEKNVAAALAAETETTPAQ
jgi:hypothetical protein